MKKHPLRIICLLLFIGSLSHAQEIPDREIHYRAEDWISYPMMRMVTSVDLGNSYVFFGTTQGISRWDYFENQWGTPFTRSDGLENDGIRIVLHDFKTGFLWCVTRAGVSYYIPTAEEWRNLSFDRLGVGRVYAIGTGNAYVWLRTDRGILKSDPTGVMFWEATEQEIAEDHIRWQGERQKNLESELPSLFMQPGYFFFPEGYIQDMEMRRFDITGTLQDGFDHIWMGTRGLGAAVAEISVSDLKLLPFGLFHSGVEAMAWDGDGMWIGGISSSREMDGITWWNMEENQWIHYESLVLSELWTAAVTSIAAGERYVWFGTPDGLARYDKSKDRWRMFDVQDHLWANRINHVALAKDALWVSTVSGINRIRIPSMVVDQIRYEPLNHRHIYQMEVDGNDVWAGTDRGIFRYTGEDETWEYIPGDPSIVAYEILAISAWEGEVWFGTENGIMAYDKETDRWQGFPPVHYPSAGQINAIVTDSEVVWVGTENGVLKYIKNENRWRRFSTEDGLLDNRVRWMLLDWDHIWFGTQKGLTRFYWNAPYRID